MFHFFGTVSDDSGNSLVNWQVEAVLVDTTDTVAIFSDENGTSISAASGIEDRAVSDAQGNYDFFVPDGTYSLRFYNAEGVLQKTQRYMPMYGNASDTVQGAVEATANDASIAQNAASQAVGASSAAISAANLFATTTEGLAGTSSGDFFQVTSSDPNGYVDLYLNDSGSAVLQSTIASKEFYENLTAPVHGVLIANDVFEAGGFIAAQSTPYAATYTRFYVNVEGGPADVQVHVNGSAVGIMPAINGEAISAISTSVDAGSTIAFFVLNGSPSSVWAQIDGGIV